MLSLRPGVQGSSARGISDRIASQLPRTFNRNARALCIGIGDHFDPEYAEGIERRKDSGSVALYGFAAARGRLITLHKDLL